KGHIEEYVSEFRITASLSSITQDPALIEFFSTGLKKPLHNRIYLMDPVPTSINKWYEKALLFKTQWTKAQAINNQAHFPSSNSRPTARPTPRNPRYVPRTTERDPNTMDVDAVRLEQAERDKQFKNSQCFGCGKQGHISRNCPDK
ncbi:hypothetical protein BS17DRAFT_646370, partial [Gyrodon lividus]